MTGFGRTLTKIDPATNQAAAVDVGSSLIALIADPHELLVINQAAINQAPWDLIAIDPTTMQPRDTKPLSEGTVTITILNGNPWVTTRDSIRAVP